MLVVIINISAREWSRCKESMSRYERHSTIITSNRPFEDWAKLLGDVVVVAPLLDRLLHHGYLLKFEGKSWRLKEAASRLAKTKKEE